MIATSSTGAAAPTEARSRVLVWDLPTRVFHWSLAASFAIAWLTAESERLRDIHLVSGYGMLALIAFRLVWGVAGTRYARFAQFVSGPRAVVRYIRSLLQGTPEHHVGHNPAGALAIVLLLTLGVLTVLSGWATYNEVGGNEAFEDLHEAIANSMLAIVIAHIAGAIVSSFVHSENLVAAMFSGRKPGAPSDGIAQRKGVIAILLAAAIAGIWAIGLGASPALLPGLDVAASQSQTADALGSRGTRAGERRGHNDDD